MPKLTLDGLEASKREAEAVVLAAEARKNKIVVIINRSREIAGGGMTPVSRLLGRERRAT